MAKTFFCDKDGTTVRGETDEELVANVQRHVADKHPDLVGKVPAELILAEAQPA
jgi:hypothetical protein